MKTCRWLANQNNPNVVYIGRGSIFGNPYSKYTKDPEFYVETRTEAIAKYKQYAIARIKNDPEFREAVKGLYGKNLGCFCSPNPCHGDILIILCQQLNSTLFGDV